MVFIPEQPIADAILLEKRSPEGERDEKYLFVSNSGLNGNIFDGVASVLKVEYTPATEEEYQKLNITEENLKKYNWLSSNTEHKPFFDQEFRKLVDELLEIYRKE